MQESSDQVALKLGHMQGGFYLFFLGAALAFLSLLVEILIPPSRTRSHSLGSHGFAGSDVDGLEVLS